MKKMLFGLCAFVTLTSFARTVAYWPFGSYGLTDASGNGYVLEANEHVDLSGTGAVLDGAQTFNTKAGLALSSCSCLTIEFWTRFKKSENVGEVFFLEQSRKYYDGSGAFMIEYKRETDVVEAVWKSGKDQGYAYSGATSAGGLLGDEAWHHIAFVIRRKLDTEAATTLYVDGKHVYTHCEGAPNNSGAALFSNDVLYIGSRANSSLKFRGEVDDLRISDEALTPDRFVKRTADQPHTLAYWPFGALGCSDASGNGNELVMNGVTYSEGGVVFDGTTSSGMTRRPFDLRGCAAGFTVECYLRVPASFPSGTAMLIEQSRDYNTGEFGAFCIDYNEDKGGSVTTAFRPRSGKYIVDRSGSIADGRWHHIAFVYDPSAEVRSCLYVDREPQTQLMTSTGVPALRNDFLYFGSRGGTEFRFAGEMDDIRITDGALEPSAFLSNRTDDDGSTVAYWPFRRDEPDADESGNGHSASESLSLGEYPAVTVECFTKKSGEWRHLARVYGNGANAQPTAVYLDYEDYAGDEYDDVVQLVSGVLPSQLGNRAVLDDVKVTAGALTPASLLRSRTDAKPKTLSHWRFDVEDLMADAGAQNNLMLVSGGMVSARDGAAEFHAKRGFTTTGYLTLSQLKSFTVECLAKMPANDFQANLLELSVNYNNCSGAFTLSTREDNARLPSGTFRTRSGWDGYKADGELPDDQQWHQFALTVNRAGGKIHTTFYVDGQEQTTSLSKSDADTAFRDDQRLYFGGREAETTTSNWREAYAYRGLMDDVRIYDGILAPEEMMTAADRTGSDAQVVAHWRFDGENPLADKSGNGHLLAGNATIASGCATFDGTSQSLNTESGFLLTPYRRLTFEAVFRTANPGVEQVLLHHSPNNTADGMPSLVLNADGSVKGGVYHDVQMTPSGLCSNRRWHHVAMELDLDSLFQGVTSVRMFVDGVEGSSRLEWNSDATQYTPLKPDRFLFIGSSKGSRFCGDIREIRITEGNLSPDEFLSLPEEDATGAPQVLAYWPFSSGNPLLDVTGNGYDLTSGSGVTFDPVRECLVCDGTGAGVASSIALPFGALEKVTVEFFAKNTGSAASFLLYTGPCDSDVKDFYLSLPGEGIRYAESHLSVSSITRNGLTRLAQNVDRSEGDLSHGWHHYALVINRSIHGADQSVLYVDGVKQRSMAAGGEYGFGCALATSVLSVGSDKDGGSPFCGMIDDVRVTASALGPDQFLTKRTGQSGMVLIFR